MASFESQRKRLVDDLSSRESLDSATEAAMRAVPRHEFLPDDRRANAYADRPLPIGNGQTISAPHMVAIMTNLLDLQPGDDVLEIGTGCGYHAAVTAELVGADHVYTVEYYDELAQRARRNLDRTGYGEVSVHAGDGKEGWPEHAPYDRAYLTCAADGFPEAVVKQVRPEGILLGPLGSRTQTLIKARRRADGSLERDRWGRVRFVPLQ
jgi:protein-L-isoaspartate(D-aspartate) O-methyltransferase